MVGKIIIALITEAIGVWPLQLVLDKPLTRFRIFCHMPVRDPEGVA